MDEAAVIVELGEVSAGPGARDRSAARVAASIRRLGEYRWVGVYDVLADEIALVGWDGPAPPAHPRFPRTQGLCGAAAATGAVVLVGDVHADPRYLTTHDSTRSEIVVPVLERDGVVGLIDVESEQPYAFGEDDKRLLERCAAAITPLWRFGSGPDAMTREAQAPDRKAEPGLDG